MENNYDYINNLLSNISDEHNLDNKKNDNTLNTLNRDLDININNKRLVEPTRFTNMNDKNKIDVNNKLNHYNFSNNQLNIPFFDNKLFNKSSRDMGRENSVNKNLNKRDKLTKNLA